MYHRVSEELDLQHYCSEKEENNLKLIAKEAKSNSSSLEELREKATMHSGAANVKPSKSGMVYLRSSDVALYAKYRAKGKCQLCEQAAPFEDKYGEPYLECHHIKWLSEGGEDSPQNTVALCPNCHRKMHVLNHRSDVMKLNHAVDESEEALSD